MIHQIIDIEHYKQLIKNYEEKGVLTNNYMMLNEVIQYISKDMLGYLSTEHNLILLVNKGICYRIYYYLNNLSEKFELPYQYNYSIEIIFRGDRFYPNIEIGYWKENGFNINLLRDFYVGKFSDMKIKSLDTNSVEISIGQTLEEIKFAINLFNSSFDPYTGDFISDKEIPEIMNKGSISVVRVNHELVGACHAYEKNKTVYLGHLAIIEKERGKKLSRLLMQEMIGRLKVDDKTRYSLWVQRNNNSAVLLYKNLGYMYSNKSTISLLKIN